MRKLVGISFAIVAIIIIISFSIIINEYDEYVSSFDFSETQNAFSQTRDVSNGVDLYFPIPQADKGAFAELFVKAIGDSLTDEVTIYDNSYHNSSNFIVYKTKEGKLTIRDNEVHYHSNSIIIKNPFEMKKFVNNFMYTMEFEFDKENTKIIKDYPITKYYIEKDPLGLRFLFYNSSMGVGSGSTSIYFNGWTNEPEIIYTLLEDSAVQKALEFTSNIDESELIKKFYSYEPKTLCEFETIEPIINKRVISGIPYYKILTKNCNYVVSDYGEDAFVLITIDGINGKNISWSLSSNIRYS